MSTVTYWAAFSGTLLIALTRFSDREPTPIYLGSDFGSPNAAG